MKELYINCSCGGGASVKTDDEATTAVTECACGKMLLWAGEGSDGTRLPTEHPLPTLGISVGDDSQSQDIFGN